MKTLEELNTIKKYLEANPEDVNINQVISDLQKSIDDTIVKKKTSAGTVNAPKGIYEPDQNFFRWGLNARGIRERWFNLNFEILRDIAQKVAPVSAIHNLRSMQIRGASRIAYNDDEVGLRVKLRDLKKAPDKKEQKTIQEIEEFLKFCGRTDFDGAEDREDYLISMNEMLTRELLTIDQVAITPRKNRKGDLLDFFLLDGATIKRTVKDTGYMNDKKIKFVQEVDSRIVETFEKDELIFYYANRRADIRKRGYGYSFLEMAIDIITSWLFGMNYNKEFFNSSSQPKGILSFDSQNIDKADLEELQREWVSMFRGIKGLWKTPFLQYNAKWQPMAPSNRDMEFNQYIQMLAAWIFAIHGCDAQELGLRLQQAQNVLTENADKKIAFSHDRGLQYLLYNIAEVYNLVIRQNENWRDYMIVPSGLVSKDQTEEVAVDEKKVQTYLTIDELRAEKDLKPLPDNLGKMILNPTFLQAMQVQQQSAMAQQQEQQQPQQTDNQDENNDDFDFEISESDLKKSKTEYVEVII